MKTLTVKDIMSDNLVTLEENETLQLAETVMRHGRIRHLPVVSGNRLVGLVTHRDLLKAQISSLAEISREESSDLKLSIEVSEIMSTEVQTVGPEESVLNAAKTIKSNKYGCLPVVDKGTLVGIITEADFIDLVISALSDQ